MGMRRGRLVRRGLLVIDSRGGLLTMGGSAVRSTSVVLRVTVICVPEISGMECAQRVRWLNSRGARLRA